MRANSIRGFTLVEIIVSVVAFGILMTLIIGVFAPQVVRGTDPLFSMRAAELGQTYLEEILGKRFAENSPSGNNQRCNDTINSQPLCTTPLGRDSGEIAGSPNNFDDVDDYIAANTPVLDQSGTPRKDYTGFAVSVAVAYAGTDINLANNDAKRITVTVTDPRGQSYVFAAYKANF